MNKRYRRLRQIVLLSWVLLFLALAGMVYILSIKINTLDRYIAEVDDVTRLEPKNGKDGYTPIKNVDYFDGQDGRNGRDGVGRDGKDGSSCTTTQVPNGAMISCTDGTTSFVANGRDGKDGAPARELEPCMVRGTESIGWRFVGTLRCNSFEAE